MGLLDIPPEVLMEIMDLGNFRISHLKDLRLVHPLFSQFLVPRVFRCVTIGFEFLKQKTLSRIFPGEKPEIITQFVKELIITTKGHEMTSRYEGTVRENVVAAALNEFTNLDLIVIDIDTLYSLSKPTTTLIKAVGKHLKGRRLHIKLHRLRSLKTCLDVIPAEVELLELKGSDRSDLNSILAAALQRQFTSPKLRTLRVPGYVFTMDNFSALITPQNRNLLANLDELHLGYQFPWNASGPIGPLNNATVKALTSLKEISIVDRRKDESFTVWEQLKQRGQKLVTIHTSQVCPNLFQYLLSPSGSNVTVLDLNLIDASSNGFANTPEVAVEFWMDVIPPLQHRLTSLTVAVVETEEKQYYFEPEDGNFWTYLREDDNPWSITAHEIHYDFPKLRRFIGYANHTPDVVSRLMGRLVSFPVLRDIGLVFGVEELTRDYGATFDSIFADVEAVEHGDWAFHLSTDLDVDILMKPSAGRGRSWYLMYKAKEYSFGPLGWEARRD